MRFKTDALGEFILDENLDLVLHAEGSVKIGVAFGIIYTDDVDLIGEQEPMLQDIHDICNEEWGCRMVDSDFVLGVKRVMTDDPETGERKIAMAMTAYIDALLSDFSAHLGTATVSTPFPEDTFILKNRSQIPQEVADKYLGMGYQRLVASVQFKQLTAQRHLLLWGKAMRSPPSRTRPSACPPSSPAPPCPSPPLARHCERPRLHYSPSV